MPAVSKRRKHSRLFGFQKKSAAVASIEIEECDDVAEDDKDSSDVGWL